MGFKYDRIPAVSKAHLLERFMESGISGIGICIWLNLICESVPVMNYVSRTFDKIDREIDP